RHRRDGTELGLGLGDDARCEARGAQRDSDYALRQLGGGRRASLSDLPGAPTAEAPVRFEALRAASRHPCTYARRGARRHHSARSRATPARPLGGTPTASPPDRRRPQRHRAPPGLSHADQRLPGRLTKRSLAQHAKLAKVEARKNALAETQRRGGKKKKILLPSDLCASASLREYFFRF